MKKKALVLGLLAACATALFIAGRLAAAKETAADDVPKARAAALMAKVQAGDLPGFFDLCDSYNPVDPKPSEASKQLLKFTELQRVEFVKQSGKPVGEVELIRTERIGKSFVRFTYLERFEWDALAWQIVFYRDGAVWKLRKANYDQNVAALFTEGR